MEQKTFAVIAALNEEKHVKGVLQGVKKYFPPSSIILVDDGSSDKTSKVGYDEGVIVLKNVINLGKGAALRTGCDYAIKQGAEIIVVLDGDAQHDPHEIPRFLELIKKYDLVLGYRKFNKAMPFVFRIGNSFINKALHVLYSMDLHDALCGYRAFTAEAYRKIRWTSSNYSLETEMIANAGKHKLKYVEIPVETIYNDKYKGTTVLDGISIVVNLLIWRLR